MFELFRNQSRSAAHAILYVTVGTLIMIWSILWYALYLRPDPNPSTSQVFLTLGVILSGLAITVIGILFGLIGRSAKAADTTLATAAGITPPVASLAPPGAPVQGVVSNNPPAAAVAAAGSSVPASTGIR